MAEPVAIRKISSILDEMNQMQDRIMRRAYDIFEQNGRLLGRDLDHWLQAERELLWKPVLELREADGEFVLEVAVSGVDPKDIDIEVTPEDIVLKRDIQHEHEEKKGTVHICEFQSGRMFHSIHLSKRINPDKVKAEIKDGLLKLKAEIVEEARAKKIKPEAAFLRPGMTHIEPSKLFGVVKGSIEFDETEREHLENCEECSRVFAAFQTYFAEDAATGKNDTSGRGSVIEYGRLQRFKQGDRVYVIGPIAENYFRAIGIVHAVTFDGKVYRYVVEFEDSGTDTFFGFELRLASSEV